MDGVILIVVIKEVWEKINVAATVSLLFGMLGAIVAAFIQWKIDRGQLKTNKEDIKIMKAALELHKKENEESFLDVRNSLSDIKESIHVSNKETREAVLESVEQIKWHLINRNINERGKLEKRK